MSTARRTPPSILPDIAAPARHRSRTQRSHLTIAVAVLIAIAVVTPGVSMAQSTPPKVSKKEAKAQAKAAKEEKKSELEARGERVNAKDERKALLAGILLTKTQKASVTEIQQRYDQQMKDLNAQLKASEKGGTADPKLVAKADALMSQERTDIRAVLSGAQVAQFEKNIQAIAAKKKKS